VVSSDAESAVVDERGVVRLLLPGAKTCATRAGDVQRVLARVIDEQTAFGDVGRALPDVFLLRGSRIGEFAGMADGEQIAALAREELAGVPDDDPVVLLVVPKRA